MRLLLAMACVGSFLVNLDNTIVNVALPDMRAQLRPGVSGLQWIVDSYLLTLGSLLVLSGSLGDRYGRRRVFEVGLLIFASGSLLSGLAPGTDWLLVFRVVQAVGASALVPVGMSIIGDVFVRPGDRAMAFSVWGGAVGLGMCAGPVLGGLLVQEWGWRAVFWIGIPVALGAASCARLVIPDSRSARRPLFDPVGQSLVLLLLFCVIYSVIEAPEFGFSSPAIQAAVATAIAAAICLWIFERRRAAPLIDFRFFRSIPFSAAMMIAVINYSAVGGLLFLNTIYLQDVRGYTALRAGLYTLPLALGMVAGAQLASWLVRSRRPAGTRATLTIAGLLTTAAAVITIFVVGTAGTALLLIGYALFGLGFGSVNVPVNYAVMAGMPRSQGGVAAALGSSSRQIGQSLGVAAFGAIAGASLGTRADRAFVPATLPCWFIVAGIGVTTIALGRLASSRGALRSAQRADIQ
jgi:EmrB/QacA subfamily drug resistance transporter